MPKRLRHPELGEYRPLNVGGITRMICDAEIRGLIRYLNDAQTHDVERSVLELLEQMLELDGMDRPLWGETKEERDIPTMVTKAGRTVLNPILKRIAPGKYQQELAITERTDRINRELRKYRFLPRTWSVGVPRPWTVIWEVLPNTLKESKLVNGLIEVNDGMALRMILDFAGAGHLNRLRRCLHCRNWLYAKFRHQDFCSTKCQQKHYAISPEWKAKRRDYMRRYRNM